MDTTTHRHPLDLADLPELAGARRAGPAGRRVPDLGQLGEDLAARHLTVDDRLEVVARNWRLASGELRGELDLIAIDHERGCVVVCEVKARRDADRFGGALAAVPHRKRAKVRALTAAFLREAALPYGRVRLDVVAIDLGRRPVLHHVLAAL
jgi:putative endonuclease